jgi:Tol biopolymer transport system component
MTSGVSRAASLLLLVGVGIAAWAVARPPAPANDREHLTWVADAHQLGPVGYRDPAGAMSPDGRWIAYSEGRFLRVRAAGGGPLIELPAGEAQIRAIAWSPDSRRMLADGFRTQSGWAVYGLDGSRTEFLGDRQPEPARAPKASDLRQPAWSPDGKSVAAIVNRRDGQDLWTIAADGSSATPRRMPNRASFPAWTPRGEIACVTTVDGRSRLTIPCGGPAVTTDPNLDVYGPVAFSPDSSTVYLSFANPSGTLDLWAAPARGGRARRLTSFSRDSYAPSVASDGSVLFKVQSYRTVVAVAPAHGGGPVSALATFQSETPSWHPDGRSIGITYGTWRRVVDDAHYPDIAQDAGIIPVSPANPVSEVSGVVHASVSEDQALCWSPNGRWIAFHSHQDQSDDVWLRAARGDGAPRRISFLGRGAETGWPRWSPDGKWLLFDGASKTSHRSVLFVIGVDQDAGQVTREPAELPVTIVDAEVSHAEWLPDSRHIIVVSKEGPGRHVVTTIGRDGGDERVVHRFASEHDAPGLAVSPDGVEFAFIAPAGDGFFQVFRMPVSGGSPLQVTTDRSNKTQPAWSPDGRQLAFTVWNYDAQFWKLR